MKHLARTVDFKTLLHHLQEEVEKGTVSETRKGYLSLFCYTNSCLYERLWNDWNTTARGLILDRENQQVIATPFPKFFNYGEMSIALPDEPFDIYEKMDGSLGIAYYYQQQWSIATKGAFNSTQAFWGTQQLLKLDLELLEPGTTYLFEMIYSENRIVVKYPFEGLVLLGAYDHNGFEVTYTHLTELAQKLSMQIVTRLNAHSIKTILEQAAQLDKNSEGFVLRFESGMRLKIKGSEYCRIHRLGSRITPLAMWDSFKNGDDLEAFRKQIPEEYWQDFDQINQILINQLNQIIAEVETYYQKYLTFSDKELGLILTSLPSLAQKFLFARRKLGANWFIQEKLKNSLYSVFRPTNNYLEGYSSSDILKRLEQE